MTKEAIRDEIDRRLAAVRTSDKQTLLYRKFFTSANSTV